MPQHKIASRTLPVNFTVDELNDLGFRLASKHREIAETQGHKKLVMDEFKQKIEELKQEEHRLATDRTNGYRLQEVACEIRYDFPAGRKEFVPPPTPERSRSLSRSRRRSVRLRSMT
jgi:hypothetical protein